MKSDYPPTEPDRADWIGRLRRQHWHENYAEGKHRTWGGVSIRKPPEDLLHYQEIIYRTRPCAIVETGGAYGGSAAFFVDMMRTFNLPGPVVSVSLEWYGDIQKRTGVSYITGSSTDPDVVREVRRRVGCNACMVVLDSAHDASHVVDELGAYHRMVGEGMYLVVEDTTVEDVPSHSRTYQDCGPREALARWLPEHLEFEAEHGPKYLTCNQGGWLRRKKPLYVNALGEPCDEHGAL